MKMFCDLKVFMRAESGRSLEEIQIFVELWYNCGIVAEGTVGTRDTRDQLHCSWIKWNDTFLSFISFIIHL